MLTTRIVAGNDSAYSHVRIKYGNHETDTVSGIIIYPDDFSFADAGAPMLPFGAKYGVAQIEKADWEAFEAWGCVFLPQMRRLEYTAEGMWINESSIQNAHYWCADENTKSNAVTIYIYNTTRTGLEMSSDARCNGWMVRLAQDY
ncbi:MAG: hypothetical protein II502_00560 [Paludibacteraceae bacterium]|nr:hypothetical protein [Paludibacteraceae bacterium]